MLWGGARGCARGTIRCVTVMVLAGLMTSFCASRCGVAMEDGMSAGGMKLLCAIVQSVQHGQGFS